MTKRIQVLFVFLFILIYLRFFDAMFLDKSVVNYLVFIAILGSILVSIPFVMPKGKGFVLPVQLMVFSTVISMVMANITWDQSFKNSIIETIPYMVWIFFFYLIHIKIPVKTIEKIIMVFGVIYAILYFYQLAQSPTVIFGKPLRGNEFELQRGMMRIIFPGAGIFILAVFISINKLTSRVRGKWFWFSFSLLGIIIPIMQVTRQFIAGILLIYLFHFLKGQPFYKKAIILAFCISMGFFIVNSGTQIFKGLNEALKEDVKEGWGNVRVQAGTYFLTEFSPDNATRVLGNGVPNWGESSYGIFVENMEKEYGYFMSDVGIIGIYAMFGVLAVIGYILIWIKSFTIPLPKENYYLKYYLWYLLFTSLTWFTVSHYHYLISTVLVLYMYQTIFRQKYKIKRPRNPVKNESKISYFKEMSNVNAV